MISFAFLMKLLCLYLKYSEAMAAAITTINDFKKDRAHLVLSPKPGQGFKPLAVNLSVFQLVLSSEGSCRPSEGSPRPQANFFLIIYMCI